MQNCLLRDSVIILTKRHCSVIQSEKERVVYCSMLADRRSPKRLYCVFSVQLTEFSRTKCTTIRTDTAEQGLSPLGLATDII